MPPLRTSSCVPALRRSRRHRRPRRVWPGSCQAEASTEPPPGSSPGALPASPSESLAGSPASGGRSARPGRGNRFASAAASTRTADRRRAGQAVAKPFRGGCARRCANAAQRRWRSRAANAAPPAAAPRPARRRQDTRRTGQRLAQTGRAARRAGADGSRASRCPGARDTGARADPARAAAPQLPPTPRGCGHADALTGRARRGRGSGASDAVAAGRTVRRLRAASGATGAAAGAATAPPRAGPGKGGAKPPPLGPRHRLPRSSSAPIRRPLTDKDRQTLETVLPLYQQNPGRFASSAMPAAASGAVEQLNSYRAALDRAQAVAAALTKAGIPSDKIQVEAAPQGEIAGESRAEVLLEH